MRVVAYLLAAVLALAAFAAAVPFIASAVTPDGTWLDVAAAGVCLTFAVGLVWLAIPKERP